MTGSTETAAPPPAAPYGGVPHGAVPPSDFTSIAGRYGVYFKILLLLVLVAFAAIALAMIEGTIRERKSRQAAVAEEIGAAWGRPQYLIGPMLVVPYRYRVNTHAVGGDAPRTEIRTGTLHLLPDALTIDTSLAPEERYRGIFRSVVYTAALTLRGSFAPPDLKALGIAAEDVAWDQATLALGLSDLRGVDGEPKLTWDGADHAFRPGAQTDMLGSGVNAAVPLAADGAKTIAFTIALKATGSREWRMAPLGKTTAATLASPWRHPSFAGAYLPAERRIGADGFSARWSISYLGRDFPQAWKSGEPGAGQTSASLRQKIFASMFGVSLVAPVDFYLQSERAVKYGVLVVVLVLAAIFVFEFAAGARFHLVQYGLVGAALCVFFLLLLSFAEVAGFALAYAAAALLSTALIAWYAGRALGSAQRGWTMAAVLATVYGFLFVVLQLEDFALISGAIALFAAVAAGMIATRNVDWYALRR